MFAAVITSPRQAALQQVPMPQPAAGEVLLKLEGSGVCASSLPLWEGRSWFQYPQPPGAPGHEGWGRVVALGAGVDAVAVGDRVAALSYRAHAEYDLAQASAVVPLPPSLTASVLPGEPLGCAMNIFRRSRVRAGQKVAVVGIGFLGALLTRLAAHSGAEVIAISRRPFALELARAAGAAHGLALADPAATAEAVRRITGEPLCEVVIEATGLQGPLDLASEITGERGRLVIAGYHQDGPRQVDMQKWNWRGIDVINAHERNPRQYVQGIREAIGLIGAGVLDPSAWITHRLPLDRLGEALELTRLRPEGFLKAVVIS
jgi:threonine dehydrogenase-like Zn-dependent dehydrogenase